MKRAVLEWAFLLSAGMALSLATLWVVSLFFDRHVYHLRVCTSQGVGDVLHFLVGYGDLSLCDQFDSDPSGNVRPLVLDPRKMVASDVLRGDHTGRFTVPGIDLRYYRMMPSGYLFWSLRVSLLLPALLSLSAATLFRSRLKRLRACVGPTAG